MNLLILMAAWLFHISGKDFPQENMSPVFVLYETNSLTFYPLSESPAFALYDNGRVIFTRKNSYGNDIHYYTEKLDSKSFYNLISELNFDSTLSSAGLTQSYSKNSDQPDNYFYRFYGKKVDVFHYYGDLRSGRDSERTKAPKRLISLFDRLINYMPKSDLKEWTPAKFELITQCHDSTKPATAWSSSLPDLNSKYTTKVEDNFYSIYLTNDQYADYLKLETKSGESRIFIINNKSCMIVTRIPFPFENYWMNLSPH